MILRSRVLVRSASWLPTARNALLLSSIGLVAASCGNTTRLPSPFIFDRPGDVDLVCFRTTSTNAERDILAKPPRADVSTDFLLPLQCCTSARTADVCGASASGAPLVGVKHALVTQNARGEVAAVDIDNQKVLDSDLRVPGYTFVDVGPFPIGVVVPKQLPQAEAAPAAGPAWTYVAGGGDVGTVRAVPTCRFLLGKECGPEQALKANSGAAAYLARTELRLDGTPQDVVLDPNGRALWLTLPQSGLLAKVSLGEQLDAPFALDGETPAAPVYYALPSADGSTLADVATSPALESACDVGSLETPPLQLPRSEPAQVSGSAQPTRLRLLPGQRDESGALLEGEQDLLFVADRGQAVLHVIALTEDAEPAPRASLPLATIVEDFAITPKVPNSEPDQPDQQFVYAVDKEGGVAAFELTFDAGAPALAPVITQVPRRIFGSAQRAFSDRLLVNGSGVASAVLDVVDTRSQPFTCDNGALGPDWFHGVFVVVASRAGGLAMIDVQDDASCRCTVDDEDERVPTRRHAPRLLNRPEPDISVSSSSSLAGDCSTSGYRQIESSVCLPNDPWRQRSGTWTAQWEGVLAGLSGELVDLGDADSFQILMPPQRDLCELGVDAADELSIAVTGTPQENLGCLIPTRDTALQLRVVEAYQDRLVVELDPSLNTGARFQLDKAELRRCYPEGISFELAVRQNYLVRDPSGSIQHRVIADPAMDGQSRRCIKDERIDPAVTFIPSAPRESEGLGPLYKDAYISFSLSASASKSTSTPISITVSKTSALYSVSNLDGSSGRLDALPARVRFFAETGDLFIVDEASQGLRRYTYTPFLADDSRFR